MNKDAAKPGFLWSIVTARCPRCRRGAMFKDMNPYRKLSLKHIFDMPEKCSVCSQRYDLEPGFWYGTGYVSYALAVAVSTTTFVAWLVLIGVAFDDNRIYYWLAVNTFLLIVLQPWLMRISRVIYMRFFVKYDPAFGKNKPVEFE